MSGAIYLYGFVPPDAPVPPADLSGIADRPVELLGFDGFGAVVSRVPAADYAAEAVEAGLADLAWVADHGVRHERIVAWFVDHARILPVRLLTLYSGTEPLRREAEARAERIRGTLRRFEGKREWDLKVSYDAVRLEERVGEVSSDIAALDAQIAAAAPGRRFLLEKKRSDLARREVSAAARRLAAELVEALDAHATRTVAVPPPRDAAAELPVVANVALLVREEDETALRDAVRGRSEALEPLGIQISFSGPWAPYRFMDDPAEGTADG